MPADTWQWNGEPFSGRLSEGWIYGRGALDAKGITAVHVMTLIELAPRDSQLERDIILLATPDEETGGRLGTSYLVRDQGEPLHDLEFVLTGGGSIRSGQPALSGS